MYAIVDPLSKKIRIVSDDDIDNVSLNRLDVYHQNVLLGYFLVTPDSNSFSKQLVFDSTLTSEDTKYIFTIEPEDIGMSEYFDDYLYHFVLSNNGSGSLPLFGTVVSRGIDCCMEKALKAALAECGGCDNTNELNTIATVKAYLDGARAAIRAGQMTTALCALKVIDSFCSDCGCYGT